MNKTHTKDTNFPLNRVENQAKTATNGQAAHLGAWNEGKGFFNEGSPAAKVKELAAQLAPKPAKDDLPEITNFPTQVFPHELENTLKNFSTSQGLNLDFLACSVLPAFAAAIGKKFKVEARPGHTQPPILWLCIVAPPSTGKSPAIDLVTEPLEVIDRQQMVEHQAQMQSYEEDLAAWKKTKDRDYSDKPVRPKERETVLKGYTYERLIQILDGNPKGIILIQDEFLGMVKGFNQYRSGNDLENMLSAFNGKSMKNSSVSRGTTFVANPNINIIGGTQPGTLPTILQLVGEGNGFLQRLLFCYPPNVRPSYWENKPLDTLKRQRYNETLTKLFNDLESCEGRILTLEESAAKVYSKYYNRLVDRTIQQNAKGNPTAASLFGKMQNYCLRFALVLEGMRHAYEGSKSFFTQISEATMRDAVTLSEYFIAQNLNIYGEATDSANPQIAKAAQLRAQGMTQEQTAEALGLISDKDGKPQKYKISRWEKQHHHIFERARERKQA